MSHLPLTMIVLSETIAQFEVLGDPTPQGSKRARLNPKTGKPILVESSGEKLRNWRSALADAARDVASMDDIDAPLDGALGLSVEFRFPMPKSRPKTVRMVGRAYKESAPDTDKLIRTVGDALKAGGLIVDDARFVRIRDVTKVEVAGWTGAIVTITRETTP